MKIQFLVPPRAVGFPVVFPLDFRHMKNKEIRSFKYQRTLFPQCQLHPSSTVLEIQVKKYNRKNRQSNVGLPAKVPKGASRFRALKNWIGDDIYLDCHPGFVDKPVVIECKWRDCRGDANGKEARGCGIGRIMIFLCMHEKKIHNTKRNRKNIALKSLKPKFKKQMKWMKSQCSKVVMLEPITYISSTWKNFKEFLASAARFGFTVMAIKVPETPNVPEALYPKAGPCLTSELASNFNNGRLNIDGGNGIAVTGDGNEWFFCLPTKKRLQQGLPSCKK